MAPRPTAAQKAAAVAAAGRAALTPNAAALAAQGSRYPWAHNVIKLNRAVAHVQQTAPDLQKGTPGHEAAVKERYVAMNGLVVGDKKVSTGKKGEVVNLADDDGSPDDAEDAA